MPFMFRGIPVKEGNAYKTTKDLGLKPIEVKGGDVKDKRQRLIFVTINYKFQNELHQDGIVHEAATKDLFPNGKIVKLKPRTYLFVRYIHEGVYLYVGEMDYGIRYDRKRNKLFIKDDKSQKLVQKPKRRRRRKASGTKGRQN